MRPLKSIVFFLCVILAAAAGSLLSALYNQYWVELPPIGQLLKYRPAAATRVYSDDGSLAGAFYLERRYLTSLQEIPPVVRHAFVAAEDADFYSHHGIDLISIARAMVANLKAGSVVQGGSTITQQVVKALALSPERSYRRKLREVMLSIRLERRLSKEEILALYLNQIYLGDGNYGIGAAARSYFGKEPQQLGIAEAALLAGLPQAPSRYSPTRNRQGALARQRYVLGRMRAEGFITAGDYHRALGGELQILPRSHHSSKPGAYYTAEVRRYLDEHFGRQAIYRQGFRVHTGMNMEMQRLAEQALRRGVELVDRKLGYLGPVQNLDRGQALAFIEKERVGSSAEIRDQQRRQAIIVRSDPGLIVVQSGADTIEINVARLPWHHSVDASDRRFHFGDIVEIELTNTKGGPGAKIVQTPRLQAALVAIEPGSGKVKALVGGFDFADSQFNRATQARRQPGSAFKPLVYAAALDNGYTPASIVLDAPIQYVDYGEVWEPQNYSRRYYGPTTLRRALEKSRNVVTVRVVQDLGVDTVVDYLSRFGFAANIGRNLSVGLGTSETSLLELTSAYSVFANGGKLTTPIFITRIENADGQMVEKFTAQTTRIMSEQTAYLITSMLEGVVQYGTGRSVRSINRPVAGKTGTTNDQRDAWFIGFTPGLVVGVWVGYDDELTLGPAGTGGRVAAPIWLDFMKATHTDTTISDFALPDGITCTHVNRKTGLRARNVGPDAYLECFAEGTEPQHFDPLLQPETRAATQRLQ
jgi:penicillin-binding protein 1A